MANVNKGAKTTESKEATKASGNGVSADNLRQRIEGAKDEGVCYVGNTGHLTAIPPTPKYTSDGRMIGMEAALEVDFRGLGITKRYLPESNKFDAEYCKRMDAWIDSGDPTVAKYNIRKLEPEAAAPPAARWDHTSVAELELFVSMKLGEDAAENTAYLKECARYELENLNRDDVLVMLESLIVGQQATHGSFDMSQVMEVR